MSLVDAWMFDPGNLTKSFLNEVLEELSSRIKSLEKVERAGCHHNLLGEPNFSVPLQDRLGVIFDRRLGSDVRLNIASKKKFYVAHKIVLACSSPYFAELFFGNQASNKSEYDVDVPVKHFGLILEYMYKQRLPERELMSRRLTDLVVAGRSFGIPNLIDYIQGFAASFISYDNVIELLQDASNLQLPALEDSCWQYIQMRTRMVINNNLDHMSFTMLLQMLDKDYLNASEYELFRFVQQWSTEECLSRNLKPTPENIRRVGCAAFRQIRYTTMDPVKFTTRIVPANVLSPSELLSIYIYLNTSPTNQKPSSLFNSFRRRAYNKFEFKDRWVESKNPARGWRVKDGEILFSKQKLLRIVDIIVSFRDNFLALCQLYAEFIEGLNNGLQDGVPDFLFE